MRLTIMALLLSISTPALADNIAGCEVVLMEKIKQEDNEGITEIASFRPAADFIASIYNDETEILRKIDGLPIRAIMCKRKSVVPSESDFPIVATGTPFMISQNFDSTETGLTTIFFKDGEFRSNYKGPELSEEVQNEMDARLKDFNAKPHDLAEKEKAMLAKKAAKDEEEDIDIDESEVSEEDESVSEDSSETLANEKPALKEEQSSSTDEAEDMDDSEAESREEETAPKDNEVTESEETKEKSE